MCDAEMDTELSSLSSHHCINAQNVFVVVVFTYYRILLGHYIKQQCLCC